MAFILFGLNVPKFGIAVFHFFAFVRYIMSLMDIYVNE